MGTMNSWSEEQFQVNMKSVGVLYTEAKKRVDFMRKYLTVDYTCGGINYDPTGRIKSGIENFTKTTVRLQNLHETMKQYLQEYTGMLENAQSTMEGVDVENTVYGTFGEMVASGTALTTAFAGSVAWQFHQQGGSFSSTTSFWESGASAWGTVIFGASEIANWNQHTYHLLTGTVDEFTTDPMLEAALLSSLEAVPGYSVTADNLNVLDWDKLGDELGIPDLKNKIKSLTGILETARKSGFTDELCDELILTISNIFEGVPGIRDFIKNFTAVLDGGEFFVNLAGWAGKGALEGLDTAQLFLDLFYHSMTNHVHQVSYLDTIEDALIMSGFENARVVSTIDTLREQYLNDEKYFFDKISDKAYSKIEEGVLGLLGELPGIKQVSGAVDGFYGIFSGTAQLLGGDEIDAYKSLVGLQQYTNVLAHSYEQYMSMIDAGIATTEDLTVADNLFILLRASKMKEYESIMTLTDPAAMDSWGEINLSKLMTMKERKKWYNLAQEKYNELAAFEGVGYNSLTGSHPASGGSGGGGGGGSF